jgi:hypothetical protein
MGAKPFKVGDSVTVFSWEQPIAIHKVAKVGVRVTLSDGSVWHVPKHSASWRQYGGHEYGRTMRAERPGDAEAIAALIAEKKADAEHKRLVGRVVGLAWGDVYKLPTESLRQIVALFDAAKEPR